MAAKKYRMEDKVDGSEMDLSLQGLVDVPIREMALYRRVTSVDLSNNHISTLPDEFPEAMSQLHNLDLSRNLIIKLPETFGQMAHIRRLDLFRNKLTRLPMSISRMDKLRWLDVKENPLVGPLAKIVGECLTTEQCEYAAKNLVHFMRQVEQQCVVEKSNGTPFDDEEDVIASSSKGKDSKTLIPPTKSKSKKKKTNLKEPESIAPPSYEDLKIEEITEEDIPQEVYGASYNADYEEISRKLKNVQKQKFESKGRIPRSRTGIHASAKSAPNLVHDESVPSYASRLAGFLVSTFKWSVRVFLFAFFFVLGVSMLTGMTVDYQQLRQTAGYKYVAYYTPEYVLNAFSSFQLEAQRFIAAVHYYFPYYPYIERGHFLQAYDWIRNTFTSAFDAIKNVFA